MTDSCFSKSNHILLIVNILHYYVLHYCLLSYAQIFDWSEIVTNTTAYLDRACLEISVSSKGLFNLTLMSADRTLNTVVKMKEFVATKWWEKFWRFWKNIFGVNLIKTSFSLSSCSCQNKLECLSGK